MKLPVDRMKDIPFEGGIREILVKAANMEKAGKNIIHLEIGRPDFTSPPPAVAALRKAIDDEKFHYCDISGVEELRVAIANYLKRTMSLEVDPNTEIVVGVGAVEGLMVTMLSLMDVGDEIILVTPAFPAYVDEALLAGVVPVIVPMKFSNGFKIDIEAIEEKINDRTRMILINSPNNPTGVMYTKEDLEKIAHLAIKHDLYVLSDEAYNAFCYDQEYYSIATFEGMRERTIVVNTTSKTFSMTGWRVGFMVASPEITKYLHKTHQNVTTSPTTYAQYGAVAAYNDSQYWTDMMVTEFKKRRDLVLSHLDNIEGIEYVKPEGAFYVFACVDKLGMTGTEFCEYILNEAEVALVPGAAFNGEQDREFVRIAYSNSTENLEEAMKRIKLAVEKLNK